VTTGEAAYTAWVDKVLNDMGPDSMETPIKVTLRTGVEPLRLAKDFDRPRAMFDAGMTGDISLDDIEAIQIAGDTYIRDGDAWTLLADLKPIKFPATERALAEAAYETVNHPPHYSFVLDGSQYEAIDLIEALGLDFHIGNALKYIIRAGSKPGEGTAQELRKAAWYLTRRADLMEGK
jgi:hypothetical protein